MKDGGPAFPIVNDDGVRDTGMSLRDYFAAQAMNGVLERASYDDRQAGESLPQVFARRCYELADAMLAEKEKTERG